MPEATPSAELADRHPVEGDTGELAVVASPELSAAFPHLVQVVGAGRVAALLATTLLVGMEVPGRDSVFLAADLRAAVEPTDRLRWSVSRVLPALGAAEVEVVVPGLAGKVRVKVRPRPTEQPSAADIASTVATGSWAGRRVVVVGGGRGLGEVAVKVAAAAGADVALTYAQGREDAERVAAEVAALHGRPVPVARYDVTDLEAIWPAEFGAPTDLAVFAAPRITVDPTRPWDGADHARMANVFVDGTIRTVLAARAAAPDGLAVWHPSTTFLDDPEAGTAEYVAAKAAAEAALHHLAAVDDGLTVRSARLPRMATDQTAGLAADQVDDPVPVVAAWFGVSGVGS